MMDQDNGFSLQKKAIKTLFVNVRGGVCIIIVLGKKGLEVVAANRIVSFPSIVLLNM